MFLLKIVTTSPYCQVIYNIWQGRPGRFISSFDFILSDGPRFLFCFSLFREFNAHTYKEMYVYKNANETIKMPAHTKTDVVPGKQTNPLFIESFVRFSLFDYTHTHTERGGEMCGNEQTLTVFIYTLCIYDDQHFVKEEIYFVGARLTFLPVALSHLVCRNRKKEKPTEIVAHSHTGPPYSTQTQDDDLPVRRRGALSSRSSGDNHFLK